MDLEPNDFPSLAVVLRSTPYQEKDLILTILTENQGKIAGFAKGARASKKTQSIPEVLDVGTFEFATSKGSLQSIRHYKSQITFKNLRKNLHAYICACCWIEAIDHLTLEAHQDSHELFEITLVALKSFDNSENAKHSCKYLCEALDLALNRSGFGSSFGNMPTGFKKLRGLVQRVEEISNRELKSWASVLEMVESLSKSEAS